MRTRSKCELKVLAAAVACASTRAHERAAAAVGLWMDMELGRGCGGDVYNTRPLQVGVHLAAPTYIICGTQVFLATVFLFGFATLGHIDIDHQNPEWA